MRASRFKLLFLASMTLICGAFAFAQEAVKSDSAIKIDTSLVLVDGIVLSKRTNSIVGDLKTGDFMLSENGKPQTITHFSREELPLSVVLLLDVSGSVQPIIDEIRKAALDALSRLKASDRVALMVFASKPKMIAGLTKDREVIAGKLDDLWRVTQEVGGGTLITMGVYEAARYLKTAAEPNERRAIVLITDDEDFNFNVPPRDVVLRELYDSGATLCGIKVSHGKAARRAMSIGTTAAITAVNPVLGGFIIGMKVFRRASSPGSTSKYFSEQTGGVMIGAKNEEVGRVFVEMMHLLRTRYTFGYEPPEGPDDGKLRLIKLGVTEKASKARGELQVFSRHGYYLNKKKTFAPAAAGLAANAAPPASLAAVVAENKGVTAPPPAMPELHIIAKAVLSPAYGCRPRTEIEAGFKNTALFLSEHSRSRNNPDLLFNGSCGGHDYFQAATATEDMALIADLGADVSIEDISIGKAFNLKDFSNLADYSRFSQKAKVEFNHVYAVMLNKSDLRGLFIFKVAGYIPNERVDIQYAVKQYQILDIKSESPGFQWGRKNAPPASEKP